MYSKFIFWVVIGAVTESQRTAGLGKVVARPLPSPFPRPAPPHLALGDHVSLSDDDYIVLLVRAYCYLIAFFYVCVGYYFRDLLNLWSIWKMCIQFVYINNDPAQNGYKLVVTNNRDEFYDRPTKPAAFWGKGNQYLSGLDDFPGREGGTWFGVGQNGKVAGLLNILTPHGPLPDKRPRGHLVTDYLTRPVTAAAYLTDLSPDAPAFNPFNLILIERSDTGAEEWTASYFSNATDSEKGSILVLKDGVYGFSNSVYSKPFRKVTRGEAKMAEVMGRFGSIAEWQNLHQALFDLMSDTTCTLPDPQLTNQGGSKLDSPLIEQRSGIYVDSSQIGYGTRTTTIFTVTADNEAEYTEKTMREPINRTQPIWDLVSYKFKLPNVNSNL